ncbi:hypothetical protein C7H19_05740 [Aphanothece hegewaldii CCALA 016]|uniref:Uncharacterized protein n=1 Tax=Aphanothece hegewaldii CCALA 016 TaxID=2107694 RepID=A0A2T1M1C8_9CHRO|nr:hypothetical protein [Aphanothece hegewaldii]PSF38486.1 hypothetical protein C7H19_05740 [Aphanothece hegewaldii CCALA 016]
MNLEKNLLPIAVTTVATLFLCVVLALLFDAKAALLGLFLIPGAVVAFQNPRLGLLALLIYLPFSSTIAFSVVKVFTVIGNYIKYSKSYPLFKIAKDAFYFPALLGIILSGEAWPKLRAKTKPLLIAIAILCGFCLLTFLFVNLPNNGLSKGLIGIKILLGYIPLILCGYYLIQQPKDLSTITRLLVVLIIICCTLGLVQYFLLLQGICPNNITLNKLPSIVDLSQTKYYPDITNKATLKANCLVGGSILYNPKLDLIRLSGTFSDPWQWGWFLISSAFITYAVCFSDPSKSWRIISWFAMGIVLVTTLISGQRIALILVPIIYIILLLVTEKRKQTLVIKLIILCTLVVFLVTQIGIVEQRVDDLVERWMYSPPHEFIAKQFVWMSSRLSLFGQGLGGSTSGARRLTEEGTLLIETYYVKLLYEIGVLGFIAFMTVVSILSFLTFKAYRSIRNPALRHWGLCVWIFVLFISYNPYYYPLSVEPVSIYYWLFAGILLKLPEIENNINPTTKTIEPEIEQGEP